MSVKPLDILIILAAAVVTTAFSLSAIRTSGDGGEIHITSEDGEFVYSLGRDGEIRIHGPIGDTVVVISDGEARVADSPCRDKICIARGVLVSPGQWTACLPNRVFVRIRPTAVREGETDAVSF